MKEINSNVHIVGGGLIGLITAFALSKFKYEIIISEKKKNTDHKKNKNDNRTTAISQGSKIFLEKLGIWENLKNHAEPIKCIKVFDRSPKNKLYFHNKESNENLGYIIKNSILIEKLLEKINKRNSIRLIYGEDINKILYESNKVVSFSKKNKCISDIIIAADGKRSSIRNLYKRTIYSKNYNQKALVITMSHSEDHHNNAIEFFYKNGPLAVLPMKKNKNKFCSSIVWSNECDIIDEVFNFSDKDLSSLLEHQTHFEIGKINKIYTKKSFYLSSHLNSKFYEKRLIYVGDSAHSIHPIAGQGWNLGVRDISNMYNLVKKYNSLGIELGNKYFCKDYNSITFHDAYALYQITDKLDGIFKKSNTAMVNLRKFGFNALEKNKFLKSLISDFAMGV